MSGFKWTKSGGPGWGLKMQDQKIQELKMRDQMSGCENAGPENFRVLHFHPLKYGPAFSVLSSCFGPPFTGAAFSVDPARHMGGLHGRKNGRAAPHRFSVVVTRWTRST